jgi:hypothetical protein
VKKVYSHGKSKDERQPNNKDKLQGKHTMASSARKEKATQHGRAYLQENKKIRISSIIAFGRIIDSQESS